MTHVLHYLLYIQLLVLTIPPSPVFKLTNRHLRTPLPSIRTEKVSPTVPQSTKVKRYYNMHAKNLPSLNDRQSVRVRNGELWSVKGKVVGKARQPRSYVVKTETGSTIRRNRRDSLITPEKFELREIPDYKSELPTSPAVESRPHQETQLATSPTIPMPNQSTTTSVVLVRRSTAFSTHGACFCHAAWTPRGKCTVFLRVPHPPGSWTPRVTTPHDVADPARDRA